MTYARISSLGMVAASLLLSGCLDSEKSPIDTENPGEKAKIETSSGGELTKGEVKFESYDNAKIPVRAAPKSAASHYGWVGVIPKDIARSCDSPLGYFSYLHFDDEDDDNQNELWLGAQNYSQQDAYVGGMAHPHGLHGAGENSTISFCQEYTGSLPQVKKDYAVLHVGGECPDYTLNGVVNGQSVKFWRRFDNEDGGNNNADNGGNALPNQAERDANGWGIMYLCFVPGDAASNYTFPPQWAQHYMVFAAEGQPYLGKFRMDDEDDANNNSWGSDNSTYNTRMQAIVSAGSNTWIKFASHDPKPITSSSGGSVCSKPAAPACTKGSSMECDQDWNVFDIKMLEWFDCAN